MLGLQQLERVSWRKADLMKHLLYWPYNVWRYDTRHIFPNSTQGVMSRPTKWVGTARYWEGEIGIHLEIDIPFLRCGPSVNSWSGLTRQYTRKRLLWSCSGEHSLSHYLVSVKDSATARRRELDLSVSHYTILYLNFDEYNRFTLSRSLKRYCLRFLRLLKSGRLKTNKK